MHGRTSMDHMQNEWARSERRRADENRRIQEGLRRKQGELVTEVGKDMTEPTRLQDVNGVAPDEHDIHVAENEGMLPRSYR